MVTPGIVTNWYPNVAFFDTVTGEQKIILDGPNTAVLYKALKYLADKEDRSSDEVLDSVVVSGLKYHLSQVRGYLYLSPAGKFWNNWAASIAVLDISHMNKLIQTIES